MDATNADTLDRTALAGLLRISVRTLTQRRGCGMILEPLPYSGGKPQWLRSEVLRWLEAGAPKASEWRKRRRTN